jgi:hypothetical protein
MYNFKFIDRLKLTLEERVNEAALHLHPHDCVWES